MSRSDSERRSSFLWQGLLILLPVAALAVLGLSAITRDRAAVQEDARRRAHEILAQISEGLGRAAAEQLTTYDALGQNWLRHCQSAVTSELTSLESKSPTNDSIFFLSPAFPQPPQPEVDQSSYELQMKFWRASFPNLKPEDVFPLHFSVKENGDLYWPPAYEPAPQPPVWLTALTREQSAAWLALEQCENDPTRAGDIDGLTVRFLATKPPDDARAYVEFLRLRRDAPGQPATQSVTNFLTFARQHTSVRSKSGVPLSSIALIEAVNQAARTGVSEAIWLEVIDQTMAHPSVMTPQILERVQATLLTNSQFSVAMKSLRELWAAEERLREMAQFLRESGKFNGLTAANLWIENDQGRWFCILTPGKESELAGRLNGVRVDTGVSITDVRVFPQAMVEQAFAQAIRNSQIGVPDYFGLFVELEGEPLRLNSQHLALSHAATGEQVLAEVVGVLTQPATLVVESQQKGDPAKSSVEIETLPGKPRFALQLALTDRNLLFAHQRQRQMIFCSVIAVSAIAALIGFITARRAFRRQLRLNELKSNFVSSVSHELRAPIASVRLMAESLERGKVLDSSKQHVYFRFIVQECQRLSGLIENVLDFSRIEQGRKQYEFEPTDLKALAEQTVGLMETYAAERHVELGFAPAVNQFSNNGYHANVDGRAIQQALVNLIDNAIKHSAADGKVTVGLEVKNNQSATGTVDLPHVQLSVEDHGTGIAANEHERIFERFYRSGSELRRQTQGVGIGLSIVKHIVEAHGGKVTVRSAPGEGSRFTIDLPLSAEAKDR